MKPILAIGTLLGITLGLLGAVVGLPYGRLSYSAFAEAIHGGVTATPVHVTLDCDLSTTATDDTCSFPAAGVSTPLVIGFTAGNNTGGTYSVASMGFDVINDDQTQLVPDAASSPAEDSNPDLANSAGEAFFGSSVGCGVSPPNPDTNASPTISDSKLTCFTGGIDGANVPDGPVHTKLASIKYHFNTSVSGTAHLTLAKVALGDDGGNEVGTCNPGVDFPMDCFGATINFGTVNTPTNTATNTPTNTATPSPTSVNTSTSTPTNTATNTPTNTATASPTSVNTSTNTPTNTATNTPTKTATSTPTSANTATNTPTNTATNTPTNTATPTRTNTATPTPTGVVVNTPTNTATSTATSTATKTPTATATNIVGATNTPTNTATNTATNTPTNTPSPTGVATFTPTNTATNTATNTPTNTPSPTGVATFTPTNTATNTATATRTNTPVPATNTATATRTNTPLPATSTATPTRTDTPVPATRTATATATAVAGDCARADVNHDGHVDFRDLIAVARHLGSNDANFDVNGDGRVNFKDLFRVLDCIFRQDNHDNHDDD